MSTTIKISLPEELRIAAEDLAREGHHASMSGFVQHLIRKEIETRQDKQRLRQMLVEALESESSELTLGELKAELLSSAKR